MAEQQADGCYPRLNGAQLQSGKFNQSIVSIMGQFIPSKAINGTISFRCADGVEIVILSEQIELPPILHDGPVLEVIGQATGNELMAFVIYELSKDTDLILYNSMLAVQHNPKFTNYFGIPCSAMSHNQ